MLVNTDNIVSISEANQNFSRVARRVDKDGAVLIVKNNRPKYILMAFDEVQGTETADNEELVQVSKSLMKKNRKAYEAFTQSK